MGYRRPAPIISVFCRLLVASANSPLSAYCPRACISLSLNFDSASSSLATRRIEIIREKIAKLHRYSQPNLKGFRNSGKFPISCSDFRVDPSSKRLFGKRSRQSAKLSQTDICNYETPRRGAFSGYARIVAEGQLLFIVITGVKVIPGRAVSPTAMAGVSHSPLTQFITRSGRGNCRKGGCENVVSVARKFPGRPLEPHFADVHRALYNNYFPMLIPYFPHFRVAIRRCRCHPPVRSNPSRDVARPRNRVS